MGCYSKQFPSECLLSCIGKYMPEYKIQGVSKSTLQLCLLIKLLQYDYNLVILNPLHSYVDSPMTCSMYCTHPLLTTDSCKKYLNILLCIFLCYCKFLIYFLNNVVITLKMLQKKLKLTKIYLSKVKIKVSLNRL